LRKVGNNNEEAHMRKSLPLLLPFLLVLLVNVVVGQEQKPVTLVSPKNGKNIPFGEPRLVWNSEPLAVFYHLDVAANSSFTTLVYPDIQVYNDTTFGTSIMAEGTYYWRVRWEGALGTSPNSETWSFTIKPLSGVEGPGSLAGDYRLQSLPNPCAGAATIRFELPRREHVTLRVFDMQGRPVQTLLDAELEAGAHSRLFDASGVSAGVYVCRLDVGGVSEMKRLVVVE
jgi:hypothetical protein